MKHLKAYAWIALCYLFGIYIFTATSLASNDSPFLGDCIDYGIVCNYLNQTADMETNFAAVKYQGNGHTIGNTISEDKANAPGIIKFGEIIGTIQIRNNPVILQGEEVKKEVKAMLASVSNYAESVVGKKDVKTSAEVKDCNNYLIDITDVKEDVVYVDADNMIDNLKAGKIQNGGLKIVLRDDQTIVLNITEKDKVEIPRYTLTVKDGKKTNEEIAESVIWNMPYVNDLAISSDGMHATIIAPKAFVNLNVTGEGWLVCDTIVRNSGEWHMIYRKLPEVTATPKVTSTPKVTQTNTQIITSTPSVTPTVTTVVTISPSPSPTSITPTSTQTLAPTPSVTPTNSPVVTMTPNTTISPSPTILISATPSNVPVYSIDEDTPLTSKELTDSETPKTSTTSKNTTTLLDDDVPLSDSTPETGDTIDIISILIIFVVCGMFIFIIMLL